MVPDNIHAQVESLRMAKPKKAPEAGGEDDAAAPKSKMKLIIGAVVVLALAGGGGFYFYKSKATAAKVDEMARLMFINRDACLFRRGTIKTLLRHVLI